MGIFTPKLNSAHTLNLSKLNFIRAFAVCLLFVGLMAFDISTIAEEAEMADPVATRDVDNTIHCNDGAAYSFYLNINGLNKRFNSTSGTFIEYDDGTAELDMNVANVEDSNLRFNISAHFSGRTFNAPANSPKENNCSDFNTSEWYYYTSTSGTATGTNGYAGAVLSFHQTGPVFQLGNGANVTDGSGNFGSSGWLDVNVESQPNNSSNQIDVSYIDGVFQGDFNFQLSGEPLSSCENVTDGGEIEAPSSVCPDYTNPDLISSLSLPTGGSGAIEYLWLASTNGCPDSLDDEVHGATNATYNPGPISQTTWYRRCARRVGCSSWDFGESNCVKIEMMPTCGEPAPTEWTVTCEDNQSVEIIGEGIRCENSFTINIPNANDVVQVIAEVVYKGNVNPSNLTIKTNNEIAIVAAEQTDPANAFYFRTTFGAADKVVLENIPNACSAQSMLLYVFREGGQTTASTGRFVQKWLYHSEHCEILEIPTAPAVRDVEIEVPLSEITTDGRIAIVRAEVVDRPSVFAEVTIDNINAGDALHIAKLTLVGVNPLDDEIQICVESPFATASTPNGQSLVYAGGVKANPDCKTCDDSDIALTSEVISNYNGAQISCAGANDGRLQAVISGGVPPFQYNWSNGMSGQIISDIAPGTYEVTVTDQFGCTAAASSVTIDEPSPVTAQIQFNTDFSGSPISCNGANDAEIEVVATGGTSPYVYQWGATGNFSTAKILSNLAPGVYEVQVSDANGCIQNAAVTIEEPEEFTGGEIEIIANYNGATISCSGAEDGILSIDAQGGTAPYIYEWSNGATTQTIENLGPGTYEVTVTDQNNCAFTRSVTIDEPAPLTLELTITTNFNGFSIDCFGENSGAITSLASGGTGNLIYNWSNGASNTNLDNLTAGTYTLTVTDQNGCDIEKTVTLTEPSELEITAEVISDFNGSDISCAGEADARAQVLISGSLAPYQINWSNGENTQIISNLGPGLYEVTVTDANGCDKISSIEVVEPQSLECAASITSNYFEGVAISTQGGSDGTATVAASGGTGNITYNWSNNASTSDISDLSAGTYSVIVADENGCTCASSVTLEDPAKVGDQIFVDANGNGIQDAGELGVENVTLTLTGTTVTGITVTRTVTTGPDGSYIFDGLLPGDYKITIGLPTDFVLTSPNVGGNDATDSDFDPSTLMTEVFTLAPGDADLEKDGGVLKKGTIGDFAWIDCNKDGKQDNGEDPLSGVEVTLSGTNGLGETVSTTTITDANGAYEFTNLIPGSYKLTFAYPVSPTGLAFTAKNNVVNPANDSDVNPATGMTDVFVLESGDLLNNLDAGFIDNENPVFTGIPQDLDISCAAVPAAPELYSDITAEDNLDDNVTIDFTETSTQASGDICSNYNYQIVRTWVAYDDCENATTRTQTINVSDNSAPQLSGVPADITVECSDVPTAANPTATDDCDSDLVIEFLEQRTDGNCAFNYTLNRTWTVIDDCGNTTSLTQKIVVEDNSEPELIGVPADIEVSCSDVPAPAVVDVADNCSLGTTVVFNEEITPGSCVHDYLIVRTWTAIDDCGNEISAEQRIQVQDKEAPVLIGVPADLSMNCESYAGYTNPLVTATDDCSDNLVVNLLEETISQTCNNGFELKLTWTVVDECGKSTSASQTIIVSDDEAPELIGVPANLTLSCLEYANYTNPIVTASDNCSIGLQVDFLEETVSQSCPNTFEVKNTWTVTDECGNTTVETQTISVSDNEDPVLSGVPANITLTCQEYADYVAPTITVSDNCTDDIQIQFLEEIISQDCANTFELKLTWTAVDECGNSTSESQTIVVKDEEDPVLSGVPANLTISCEEYTGYDASVVTVTDNCSANIQIEFTEEVVSQSCPNTFELKLTWTATDECGNSTSESQSIIVTDDQEPVLSGIPPDLVVSCENYFGSNPNVVTVSDNCTDDIQIEFTQEVISQTCPNTFELKLTWTAVDECGNSTSETQTIVVTDDQDPVLSGVPANLTVSCEDYTGYDASIVTVSDNCTDDIQIEFTEEVISQTCPNTFELKLTWTAVDECGNSTSETQTIVVTDDQDPVLSGVPANLTVSCEDYTGYDASVVTVTDNCTDDIQIEFTEEVISQSCPNTFELKLTWTAVDECGNSTSKTQTIIVTDDQDPVLSRVPANLTVSCEDYTGYDASVVTVSDNCTDDIQIAFLEEVISQSCANTFELKLTWTAVDECGNSTSETQFITVEDNTKPELQGVAGNVNVDCDAIPAIPVIGVDITASDNCTDDLTIDFIEVVTDGSCANEYILTRTWTVVDDCGNSTVETQQIFVSDQEKPQLEGVPADATVSCGALPIADPTVTATDNCTQDLTIEFEETITPGACDFTYSILRVWTVTDECGNTAEAQQTIQVSDDSSPSLESAPADVTVSCDNIPSAATLLATDDCAGSFEADFQELFEPGNCDNSYTLTRVWTATDACGNQTSETQVVTVSDDEKPVLEGVPGNESYSCISFGNLPVPTVTAVDNCDQTIDVVFVENEVAGLCPNTFTLTRTWTATDACGNIASASQVVEVTDNIDPVLIGVPIDITISCGQIPAVVNVVGEDTCQDDVDVLFQESNEVGDCPGNFVLIRTWTAIDACGNQSSESQRINVTDLDAPVLSLLPADVIVNLANGEQIPTAPVVTSLDDCMGAVAVDFIETESPNGNCGYLITRTWSAEDECGNAVSHIQTITVLEELNATLTPSTITICVGESTDFVVNTQGAGLNFDWDANGGSVSSNNETATFTADQTGSYNIEVIVSDQNGCSATLNSQIIVVNPIDVTAGSNSPICGGGDIELTASGGTTYEWTGPNGFTSSEENPVIENVSDDNAGTYSVTVSNGTCSAVQTVEVIVGPELIVDFSIFPADCGEFGSINVGYVGGTGVVIADWSDLPGNNDPFFRDDLIPGSYDVTVSDENGCSETLNGLVIEDACQCDAFAGTLDQDQTNYCLNQGSATISAMPNGDAIVPAGYETIYVLTEGSDLVIVEAGANPTFTVSDLNNYTIHTLVYDPATLDLSTIVFGQTTGSEIFGLLTQGSGTICGALDLEGASFEGIETFAEVVYTKSEYCDLSNGVAKLEPLNYSYAWSDGGSGAERNNLAAGSYQVLATSPLGCEIALEVVIENECSCVAPLINDIIVFEAHCGEIDASAEIIPVGTVSNYSYTWSTNLGVPNGLGNKRSNLAPGFYSVTITSNDFANCSTVVDIAVGTIGGATVEEVIVQSATCGSNNGTVSLLPATNTYLWSDGNFTGATRADLAPGTYEVIVSDGSLPSCIDVILIEVEEESILTVSNRIIQAPTCDEADGTVEVIVDNGSGNYEFLWEDQTQLSDGTRSGLAKGVHEVVITDLSSGCSVTHTFVINNDVPNADIQMLSLENESCVGVENGAVSFDYSTSNDLALPASANVIDNTGAEVNQNNLAPGDYFLLVEDANGCIAENLNFSIQEATEIRVNVGILDQTCDPDGSIQIEISGGTADYTFNWADLSGSNNSKDRTGLVAGDYTLNIEDAEGCSLEIVNIELGQACNSSSACTDPVIANIVVIETDCDESTGSITVQMFDDVTNYKFFLSPAAGTANGNVFTDLPSGVYEVLVEDGSNVTCSITQTVVVQNANGPQASLVQTSPAQCGMNNGTAVMTPFTLDYEWCNGSTAFNPSDLPAGTCFVTVTDPATGCENVFAVEIGEQNNLQAFENVINTPDCNLADGAVEIVVSGGSGTYSLAWSDGGSGLQRNDLEDGAYSVEITDQTTGCSITYDFGLAGAVQGSAQINVNSSLPIEVTCAGTNDGTLDYSLTTSADFQGPAQVAILDANGTEIDNGDLTAGTYDLLVSDVNGCLANSLSFEVIDPQELKLDIAIQDASCQDAGRIVVVASGGIPGYQFDWADIAGSNNVANRTNLSAATYSLEVTDDNGCFVSVQNLEVEDTCLDCGTPESMDVTLLTNSSDQICFALEACFDPSQVTYTLADGTMLGSSQYGDWELDQNGCLIYNSDDLEGNDVDEICIIATDGTNSDTTCIVFSVFSMPLGGPGTDTIYVSTPMGTTLDGCLNIDDLGGVVTGSSTLSSGNSGSFSVVNGNCYQYIPNPGVTGSFVDTATVVLCNINLMICDTTLVIISIEALTTPTTDTIYVSTPMGTTLDGCLDIDELGGVVTGSSTLSTGNFGSFSVVNGNCYQYIPNPGVTGSFVDTATVVLCNINLMICDTTLVIISIEALTTPTTDTIYVSTPMGTTLDGCLDIDELGGVVTGSSTQSTGNFGSFSVVNGNCYEYTPNPGVTGSFVDTATVVLCNINLMQCDTTIVIISIEALSTPTTDTIYVSTPMDVTLDSCLNIDELGGVVTGSSTLSTGNFGSFSVVNGNCYQYIPNPGVSGPFLDTATVVLCNINLMVCDTTIIVISVTNTANCDSYYDGPTTFVIDDCVQGAPICLDFEIGDLFNFEITDNGAPYDGAFDVCVIDTQYQYVAFQLGAPGAYTLDEWTANGQTFTLDLFTSTQQLADSMNVWDPAGDWQVFGFVIVGGNGTGDYGSLLISANMVPQFEVPNQIIPDATQIYLSEGPHNLLIENLTDGCFQNITFDVTCTNPPILIDTLLTINVGTQDTFCFAVNNVATVQNLCTDQSDGNTSFNLVPGTNCISLSGILLGNDLYCFEVCDDQGVCQTINVEVQVVPVTDTIIQVINLGTTDSLCLDTTIFQNALDVFINDCDNPNNLNVDFVLNNDTYCVAYNADLIGQDTACLVICDSLGLCDTTILIVQVIVPTPDTLEIPVLVGTNDTLCLDASELTGPIRNIFNICPQSVGENVDFIIDPISNCILYTGTIVGQDTACLVICDAQMVCDTTYVIFDVFNNLLPVAIDDDTITTIGNSVVIEVLLNDTINGNLEGFDIIGFPSNGTVFINPDGTITYTPNEGFCGIDQFMYSITNEFGSDVALVTIEVLCDELIIFSGFSPNGDGKNDVFTIHGIENFPNNEVCVFNRWGNQVLNEKGYTNDRGWEGTFDGKRLPDGTYFYVIDDGEGTTYSGYLQLHR